MSDIEQNRVRQEEIPVQGMLDSFLVAVRVISSIGAVAAITIGIVLAIQLFGFFRLLIEEPATTIAAWQLAMDRGRPAVAPVAPEDDAETSVVPAETPTVPGDSPTDVAASGAEAPVTPAPDEDNPELEDRKHRASRGGMDDEPPLVDVATLLLDRLEVGEFSWLIGVGFLVIFCWLLLKIPVMLITTGTRLLLGLVNVSAD